MVKHKELPKGKVVLYKHTFEVRLEKETIWLSLNQMAELFGRDKSVISRHLNNIFKSNELKRSATVAFFATVQSEGERLIERKIEHFNLDAIISDGILLRKDGIRRIDENTLVALTIMIAISNPSEKDTMIKVILNLLT
ncbi:MAG: hypothetical protein MRK02_01660 [Candidatus Scalindua sp.]|nr:hypothetical protein [Candidatus Scalindua sp.]